ncbi:MAG: cell division protein FtsB [Gammaproteobacteria bacterium]|uniref:cell division protein FtsB n=1 Tax=Pseudomaricurvus alcaniphilus TaxID=1166482 RepID=UPI00140B3923|nr:cell division protein FtsB [Pseudomaricurvus alcaniphilus]MBR9909154.1 cell division protein FtsB [Gammaproteobacteria bacterium]NHN39935.1 cell division protein FtsB [Pseudomaricurvus alcaniphilus]
MKWLALTLLVLLAVLQYRLWVGDGSLAAVVRLQRAVQSQDLENQRLQQRNEILAAEVRGLKSGLDAVEERAREDLGMIKPGETFYMVVEPEE